MPKTDRITREKRTELKIRIIKVKDWFDQRELNRSYSALFLCNYPDMDHLKYRIVNVWNQKTVDEDIIQKFESIIQNQEEFRQNNL